MRISFVADAGLHDFHSDCSKMQSCRKHSTYEGHELLFASCATCSFMSFEGYPYSCYDDDVDDNNNNNDTDTEYQY